VNTLRDGLSGRTGAILAITMTLRSTQPHMQCLKGSFVCGSKAARDLSHISTVSYVFIA